MLPEPEWDVVGQTSASVQIKKKNGRIHWNAKVQQYLGFPETVMLEYDDELNVIGISRGFDYVVVEDEDGEYYIEAKTALEECGLSFPLDNNLSFEPDPPINSSNRVILNL